MRLKDIIDKKVHFDELGLKIISYSNALFAGKEAILDFQEWLQDHSDDYIQVEKGKWTNLLDGGRVIDIEELFSIYNK